MFERKKNRAVELCITVRDTWEDEDGMYQYDKDSQLTHQSRITFDISDEEIKQVIKYAFKDFEKYLEEGMFV